MYFGRLIFSREQKDNKPNYRKEFPELHRLDGGGTWKYYNIIS